MFEELHTLTIEPLTRLTGHVERLVAGRLWLKVLFGMAAGVGLGFALGPEAGLVAPDLADTAVGWLALPGMLFLALVQMVVVVLVFASIIRGLGASDNAAQLRALGLRAAAYFVVSSGLAIALGLAVAFAISPGAHIDLSALPDLGPVRVDALGGGDATLPERLVGLLPANPVAAMANGEMLQVVLVAIMVGIAMVAMPVERSRPLFDLLGSLQEVCMTIVHWAMRLAPLAVFGLMTRATATLGLDTLTAMGVYVVTVLVGLALLLVAYTLLAALVGGVGPRAFLRAAREVQLLAFSTSSSAAVMPLSLQIAEKRLGVRPATARFVIPLGATINMDGTALYQGVATVFLAQAFGVELTTVQLLLVVVTAVAASIGAPGTPGVGIVILATVLASVGIPAAGLALILGVDRLLDMSRTTVNVTGDLTAALVLDRWMGDRLTASSPTSG